MNRPTKYRTSGAKKDLEWLKKDHPESWDRVQFLLDEVEFERSRADGVMLEVDKFIAQVSSGPLETAYQMIRKEKEYRRFEQLAPMKWNTDK